MAIATTNKLDLFYDSDSSRPNITTLSVSENSLNSSKYLSGVRFYSIGDVFNIQLQAEKVYDNTYSQTQIVVDLSDFAADNLLLNEQSSGVTGPNTPPHIGDSFLYNSTFTITQSDKFSDDAIARATPYDPIGSGNIFSSASNNMLVLTHDQEADDKNEYFYDEIYRLPNGDYDNIPSDITNQWSSSNLLTNGNSQVWPGSLIYPDTDYTSYKPTQTANYSGFTGEQIYLRAFKDTKPHTNIVLKFEGWSVSEWPYSNIQLEIKLPTQTGWLRGDLPYNSADFTGSDGDGCFVASNSSGNEFYFTFGSFSTANSGYLIILRINYKNNSNLREISQISAVNW